MKIRTVVCVILWTVFFVSDTFAHDLPKTLTIQNDRYQISVHPTLTKEDYFTVRRLDTIAVTQVKPQLCLQMLTADPQLFVHRDGPNPVAGWKSGTKAETDLFRINGTQFLYAHKAAQTGGAELTFTYKSTAQGKAGLKVYLPPGNEAPVFEMHLTAAKDGWYSLGFTGLSARDTSLVNFMYQPMNWSWRRFPSQSFLSPEAFCLTAATFVTDHAITEGLSPDPSEIPYRYAFTGNSLYGLALRDQNGKAKPMLFAPVLGGKGSSMKAGQKYAFRVRYIVKPGDWYTGVQHILYDVFHYRNERQNASVSLNETLENMIDFAMGPYGGWIEELKAHDYRQDALGTVKNVSAMHPLSVSLVTGNVEIYKKRALPMMEYIMSREKFLYSVSDTLHMQQPSHFLKGPCAEIGELSGLYNLMHGRTEVFKQEAERIFGKSRRLNLNTNTGGGAWQDYLALYRISRSPAHLEQAVKKADSVIATRVNRYPNDSPSGFFYTEFTPKVFDFIELYEETKEERFLKAASLGARQMLLWLRSNPMAPDSVITVNKGNKVTGWAPKQYKYNSSQSAPNFDYTISIPEQKVPAWQTSLVGLPPEANTTYIKNGPIMLTHHAPFFLRLAHFTRDSLLKQAAYNGVIGRYANFPGYYHTSLHTNVYQKPGYPLHDFMDMRYNNMFYNHVWPHIAMVLDFIVSDAFRISEGKINFPSAFAPGYAFLTSKVYGHHPGEVLGDKNVRLWLPAKAIKSCNASLNHLFGVGEKDLYLVLMNTSAQPVNSVIHLNPHVIPWDAGVVYEAEVYDKADGKTKIPMVEGKITTSVPPKGFQVVKINNLKVGKVWPGQTAPPAHQLKRNTYFREDTQSSLGIFTGMVFNLVPQFSDAYVYIDATEKNLSTATLRYRVNGGQWQNRANKKYPFEFSIHLGKADSEIECQIIARDLKGEEVKSQLIYLNSKADE